MNGIILVDKPQDWTSSDVVAKLRGILHERRIGHSGTLDPLATGLLVVFVGRATRAAEYAEAQAKRYVAGLRLGITTDTQDITGNVLAQSDVKVTEAELRTVLSRFTGEISQIPPMYSAIKVNGQKLYDIARRGGTVERKARNISIHSIDILGQQDGDYILDVHCSKGTYIRTLCNDIGEALGCGACMSSLRRTGAGDYSLERAYTLAEIQKAADEGRVEELLMPVDSLFGYAGEYRCNENEEKKLRVGARPKTRLPAGEYRVYSPSGEFLALCRSEAGELITIKNYFEVK